MFGDISDAFQLSMTGTWHLSIQIKHGPIVRRRGGGFCSPTHTASLVVYVGWRTELFAFGLHSHRDSTGCLYWRLQMNDQIAPLKPIRHLATQAGCCHWAPIDPLATDAPDGAREWPATPNAVESAVPPVEKKPG